VWREQHRKPVLEVYVFALKSGRSMFIRTPDDYRVLIDGGANADIVRQITQIVPFYSRRIDAIIATNTDGKNVSGLIDVVSRYDVGRTYIPRLTLENLGIATSTDEIYETFIETLADKKIETSEIVAGDTLHLGEEVMLHALFPPPAHAFEYSKASAPEILFTLSYRSASLTFMGDASKKVQKYITSSSSEIIADSDVLVVSHAAASAHMSTELMDILRPESLIYEKAVSKSTTQSSKTSSKKNKVVDPLATVLNGNRFNLKEMGTTLITSNGEDVEIKKAGSAGF
jgi:competence protein ComEC